MKRAGLFFSAFLVILAFLSGCKETEIEEVKISLNKSVLNLSKGQTEQLTPTITPSSAKVDLEWSSADKAVAKVSNDGDVTGVAAGETVVTVRAGEASATCKVIVNPTAVEEVKLDKETAEMIIGEKLTLKATVLPADADDAVLTWKSLNAEVASVDSKGEVLALKDGSATIVATAGGKSAQCVITVNKPFVHVESVKITKSVAKIVEGESFAFDAAVTPEDATDKSLSWESSNPDVLSVSADGNAVAKAPGKVEVTVRSVDGGKTDKCTVEVEAAYVAVEKVELLGVTAPVEMIKGDVKTFEAKVSPEKATDKTVVWSVSDDKVLSVDQNGKVTAIGGGKANVVVTAKDSGKKAECEVVVTVPVTGITLNKTTMELTEGDDVVLTATVLPEDATNKKVTWISSDETVATVKDGKVTALKPGTAKITVKTEDGGKTAECQVTVVAKVYPVTGVTLDRTSAELTEGDELVLAVTVSPANATNKNVTWISSDETVATVKDGKVTALKPGTVKITVKTEDGGKTAECQLTVVAKVYPVTGVTLDKTSAELTEGDELVLAATIAPANASNKNVTWTSSDETVATVKDGKVTALKPGTVRIIVKTSDGGKTAECQVTVVAKVYPVTGVTLDKTSAELTEGDELVLAATVSPANASNKNVTWTSSDETVATVKDGKVTALKPGTVRIIVKTSDGGKTAECQVTVVAKVYPVTGVTLDKTSAELTEGDELVLAATVSPTNATNKNVTWTSSDETVATVKDGKVTALKPGTAKITVKTEDGGKTAECVVQVKAKVIRVESVKITSVPQDNTMEVNDEFAFTVSVLPENATDKSVTWSSSSKSVLIVDDNGKVKALAEGTADIVVKSTDGGLTDKRTITVKSPVVNVTSIEITSKPASNKMTVGDVFEFVAKVSPDNATDKTVKWSSSKTDVVTIDSSTGKATAKAAGVSTITAVSDDEKVSASVSITVAPSEPTGNVTSVTLSTENNAESLRHGKTLQIIPTYSPAGAYPANSLWRSSNQELATVNENGLVKAVSFDYDQPHLYYSQNGYPEVTITHQADGRIATYKIQILPAVPEKIVVPNPPPATLQVGQSWDMGDMYILPAEAEQKITIISTFNGEFGGEIGSSFNASKVGTMGIQITAMGEHAQTVHTGTTINYNIQVTPIEVTAVTMSRSSYTVAQGSQFDLTCTVSPGNATYKNITWTSSNTSVATVKDGRVVAVSSGNAVITATSVNGKKAQCNVTVTSPSSVKVGDYYYSDGTTSSELQSGKTPVGIVFAIADPVGSDPAVLGKEHSGCTHGLVVGLDSYKSKLSSEMYPAVSQANVYNNALSEGMADMRSTAVMCGYSNTAAFRKWGNTWAFLDKMSVASSEYKLPSSTSGWYLPSVAEFDLLKDVNVLVNDKMKAIDKSHEFAVDARFWTSTYFGLSSNSYTYVVIARSGVDPGLASGSSIISSEYNVRFIFAF